jgi:hypothetical protein
MWERRKKRGRMKIGERRKGRNKEREMERESEGKREGKGRVEER